MVVSDKYKYIFIELPFTASTAISTELCENYGGEKILRKHSRYHEFLSICSREQKKYFTFSCIRNPLDAMVSVFLKLKHNHKGRFTNPKEWKANGGSVTSKELSRFHYIQQYNLNFPLYFKKYFYYPYDNWSRLDHKNFDFIIRFENIQEDFSNVLKQIGLEQIRPLPQINKTQSKEKEYAKYFTPEIRQRAVNVFGPFMERWNYDLLEQWKELKISPIWRLEFFILGVIRYMYWKVTWKSTTKQRKEKRIIKR